jgi:hypothetical protein
MVLSSLQVTLMVLLESHGAPVRCCYSFTEEEISPAMVNNLSIVTEQQSGRTQMHCLVSAPLASLSTILPFPVMQTW